MNMNVKRTDPWIPVGHPEYKWTPGANVQALWRKYGWIPPSEQRPALAADTEHRQLSWGGSVQ